jgi:hypothetical protein
LALAVTLGAALLIGAGPSTVVYPLQSIPLNFDHRLHLQPDAAACSDCHEAAETSVRVDDRLLPIKDDTCAYCHDVEDPGECTLCHPAGAARRASFPPARLIFPHRRHVAAGVDCEDCHVGVREVALATRDQLPREARCVGCHAERSVSTKCRTCHLTGPDGLLRTWFPPTPLDDPDKLPPAGRPELVASTPTFQGRLVPRGARGAAHDADWHRSHGPVANADPAMCSNCHGPDHCRACHGGALRPIRLHPDDWLTVHPLAAQGADLECQSCHRLQTFCRDCHRRTGVVSRGEDSDFALPGGLDFHPPGWTTFPTPGLASAPSHHSIAAQRDLGSCASCHSESTCVRCHASTGHGPGGQGLGISPHPIGFAASCDRLLSRNPTACQTCHGSDYRCP